MPKTRKTLLPLDLIGYDVYKEDTSATSEYFQISNLSSLFTGGKNSFLLGGSSYLKSGSEILIEILDSEGVPIYQSTIDNYTEGNSKLISVEIYDTTPTGFCTIIIMGKAVITSDGTEIPDVWKNTYNVRWTKRILVDYDINNTSPLRFLNEPQIDVTENRFCNILSASYDTRIVDFTSSLTPLLFSGVQIGYGIEAIAPSTFSSDHYNGIFTGSLTIQSKTVPISLQITDILNSTKAFTKGYLIDSTINNGYITNFYLTSGSYTTNILGTTYPITSSTQLQYSVLLEPLTNVPKSYANIRVSNLNTVSGELYKIRVYNKVATNLSDFKLIGDVLVKTEEILVSSSIRGNVPISDIYLASNYQDNWYAGTLTQNTAFRQQLYTVSGSPAYYNPSILNTEYVPEFTANFDGGVVTGSTNKTFIKTNSGSATNGWNGQVYSSEGYSQNLYISAKATSTTQSVMFGLNTDPTTNPSTSSIDYAWYLTDIGNLEAYETGSSMAVYGTYTTASVLSIVYEDATIKYLVDNVVQYTKSRTIPDKLYFDSSFFYTSSQGITDVKFGPLAKNFNILSNNETLLSSIYANIPVDSSTNKFSGSVSQSGYFLGTRQSYTLYPTSEYTLTFDAYYKQTSESINLSGNLPKVDIYLVGSGNDKIISDNPLGQFIGKLQVFGEAQRYQQQQFNFIPTIKEPGLVGLRFVVSNGFWKFSNISLKPATETQFSPDEVQILIPNNDYHNQLLQYKVEFFDINSNSANVYTTSVPTFFTGSVIDLGVLP